MKNSIKIVLRHYLENNISKELFQKSLDNYFEKSRAKQLQSKHPNSQWKTINGAKVLVGENGNVIAGANGRLSKKEEKEITPEIVNKIQNSSWNEKIYGSEKYGYNIYLDGNKTEISKEEKSQLDSHQKKKVEERKIKDIQRKKIEAEKDKKLELKKVSGFKNKKPIDDFKEIIQANKKTKEIVGGKRWNGKVYGKKGSQSIYLNGDEVFVSDKQAESLDKSYYDIAVKTKDYQLDEANKEFTVSLNHIIEGYLSDKNILKTMQGVSDRQVLEYLPKISIDKSFNKVKTPHGIVDFSLYTIKIGDEVVRISAGSRMGDKVKFQEKISKKQLEQVQKQLK